LNFLIYLHTYIHTYIYSNLYCTFFSFLEIDKLFSGEEGSGRFLDLHALHEQYVNLKNFKKTDYLTYLSEFDHFSDYPKEHKYNGEYLK
jgi:hypothetical protein